MYPPATEILGPKHPDIPIGMPPVAWHASGGQNSLLKPIASDVTQRARRGLYATMTYVDSLVGDVLDELDHLNLSSSTIVTFMGDHGQQVGEHNL